MKLSDFLEEAAIMKEMKHPNLVQVTIFHLFAQKLVLHNAHCSALDIVLGATANAFVKQRIRTIVRERQFNTEKRRSRRKVPCHEDSRHRQVP